MKLPPQSIETPQKTPAACGVLSFDQAQRRPKRGKNDARQVWFCNIALVLNSTSTRVTAVDRRWPNWHWYRQSLCCSPPASPAWGRRCLRSRAASLLLPDDLEHAIPHLSHALVRPGSCAVVFLSRRLICFGCKSQIKGAASDCASVFPDRFAYRCPRLGFLLH